MIANNEDLAAALQRLNRSFEPAGDVGVYLVSMGPGQPPCALHLSPPVLVVQVEVAPVFELGDRERAQFFRRLLELNASGLLHAAFAIEADQIVLTAALPLENLDSNELEAVFGDLDMTLAEHVPALVELAKSLGAA
jgi:Putative bacterial sensory transduction regulator